MTEIVMDAERPTPTEGTEKCSQPGCIRPAPHEGMRHRYAPTKDLQPEPEPEPVETPVPDERPFSGPVEAKPRNHALTIIDEAKGLYVAWDTCAGCNHHITRCWCPSGPKTPEYIQRWRDAQFPLAQPTTGEAKQIARDIAVDLGIHKESERFDTTPPGDVGADPDPHIRIATHMCDACGEPLYLLDTPSGKSALTVSGDSNYCTVNDDAIHIVRGITDDDRKHNPQWFGGEDDDLDDDQPDADDDEAEQQQEVEASTPVDQTTVETEDMSNTIDPEVGF